MVSESVTFVHGPCHNYFNLVYLILIVIGHQGVQTLNASQAKSSTAVTDTLAPVSIHVERASVLNLLLLKSIIQDSGVIIRKGIRLRWFWRIQGYKISRGKDISEK